MRLDRRKLLAFGAVGVAAAAAGALVGPLVLQRSSGAPQLLSTVFPDLEGQPRRLRDWSGRVAVCNFWATWCAPCREEIPLLAAMHRKRASEGVEVVGIGIDTVAKISEYAAIFQIPYTLLVGDARALEVMRVLGNQAGALPYTVILDRSGAVRHRKLGAFKGGELQEVLAGLMQ